MQIAEGIKDLIRLDNSVALPGLGFFQLKKESANVSLGDGSFEAPKVHLEFVNDKYSKDNRLSNYLSKRNRISREEGQAVVEVFIDKLKMIAASNEELVIENLGKFYGKNERLYFDAAIYNQRVKKALPSFKVVPIERSVQEKKNIQTITPKREFSRTRRSSPGINWGQILTGLLLFLFLGLIGKWIYDGFKSEREPLVTHENPIDHTDVKTNHEIDPEDHSESKNSEEDQEKDPINSSKDPIDEPINEPGQDNNSNSSNTEEDLKSELVESIIINGESLIPRIVNGENCAIIVGVFGNRSNAERLKNKLTAAGYEAYSLPYGKIQRVGAQVRCDEENIRENLAKLKRDFEPNAWLME